MPTGVELSVGDWAIDTENDSAECQEAIVVEIPDQPIEGGSIGAFLATVAGVNPPYPPTDPVARVEPRDHT